MTIRGNPISFSTRKKRIMKEQESKIDEQIKELQKKISENLSSVEEIVIKELVTKQNELEYIRKQKIEGVMLRSRSRYYDLGEKPTSYLEKRIFFK